MNKLFYIKLLCLVFILLNTNEGNSNTFLNKKTVQLSSSISNSIIHAPILKVNVGYIMAEMNLMITILIQINGLYMTIIILMVSHRE